jgi:hypothetical protein
MIITVILSMALAFAIMPSCSPAQKAAYEADKAKLAAWWENNQPQVAALLGQTQKAMDAIQADYPFWSGLVCGTLRVAGINITQAQMDAALPYIKMADTNLSILGKVAGKQKVEAGDLKNAVGATTDALPVLKNAALSNPTLAALYKAYLGDLANVPPPKPQTPPTAPATAPGAPTAT